MHKSFSVEFRRVYILGIEELYDIIFTKFLINAYLEYRVWNWRFLELGYTICSLRQ